jgi:ribulose-phosphate 3-epimerase
MISGAKLKISASILSCDYSKLKKEINKVKKCNMLHLDVMDGHFVPNISFGAAFISSLRRISQQFFDVHLMISNPLQYIKIFANIGSDLITFHAESDSDVFETIQKIRKYKKMVGLAIKPATDVNTIIKYLEYIDLILVMTVEPGFGEQKFIFEQMKKVEILRKKIKTENLKTLIQIDGGINAETVKIAKNFGADICVVGSAIFKSKNVNKTIKLLKK